MHADGGAGGSGTQFHQVAYLIDQPQPVAASGVRRRTPPAGQRVRDDALVVDLADNFIVVVPHGQGPGSAGVPQRVRRDLAYREHEVAGPAAGQADLERPGEY
jgi:hypothetical protein